MKKSGIFACGLLLLGIQSTIQARLTQGEEKAKKLIEEFLDLKRGASRSWTCFLNELRNVLIHEQAHAQQVQELHKKLFKATNIITISTTLEDYKRFLPEEIRKEIEGHTLFDLRKALERSFAPAKKKCTEEHKKPKK